ncbi:MAG: chemotaxis protein CheW [Leptospiraceae bacterium]|nr:chemotaxis protein CheW [Leptospiraceae bacterium]
MDLKQTELIENFLVFEVNNSIYAIPSASVIELIWLPELKPVESSPFYIVGYFNFRGIFLSVIDLSLRQGMKTKRYSIQDRILVIEFNGNKFGIHINEVFNVVDIKISNSIRNDNRGNDSSITSFILQTEFGMTEVLNLEKLLESPTNQIQKNENFNQSYINKLFSGISEKDKDTLVKRRISYAKQTAIEEYSSLLSVVIFKLGEEYFSIELKYILEFSNGEGIAKIPCVPKHIIGCLNLRGDILILLDLLYMIQSESIDLSEHKKIIVIKHGEMVAGFAVDKLIDVVYLSKDQILGTPIDRKNNTKEFLKGSCMHDSNMVGMLDIEKIFNYENLFVEEFVTVQRKN